MEWEWCGREKSWFHLLSQLLPGWTCGVHWKFEKILDVSTLTQSVQLPSITPKKSRSCWCVQYHIEICVKPWKLPRTWKSVEWTHSLLGEGNSLAPAIFTLTDRWWWKPPLQKINKESRRTVAFLVIIGAVKVRSYSTKGLNQCVRTSHIFIQRNSVDYLRNIFSEHDWKRTDVSTVTGVVFGY